MRVLAIESSCDETAAAIVDADGHVHAESVASQIKVHAPYGGVVPELASRAHLRALVPVVQQTLAQVDGGLGSVDAVAATQGPGLAGALLVGVQAAKGIAWSRKLPFVGVDHLEGHLLSVHLRREPADRGPPGPFIGLLASGGHTAVYRVAGLEDIELLGQTRDDAAGEAFDKVAKLLNLGYPGGPVVDRLAAQGRADAFDFPRPMLNALGYAFSFSGLKTAVASHLRQRKQPPTEPELADLCASFQQAVVEVLVHKSLRACQDLGIDALVLTGGVAANRGLRAYAQDKARAQGVALFVPPFASCTDNAAMIAYVGALKLARNQQDGFDLSPYSRAPSRKRGKF